MSFSPNMFISNIHGKDGLAKPNRFEVVLPIPPTVANHIGNSVIEKILNFPNSVFSDVSEAINGALGQEPADGFSKSGNTAVSRYLALQCENAELPGRTLATADVKIYGPTFKVPYQSMYGDMNLTFLVPKSKSCFYWYQNDQNLSIVNKVMARENNDLKGTCPHVLVKMNFQQLFERNLKNTQILENWYILYGSPFCR